MTSWFSDVAKGAAELNNLSTKTGLAVEQLSIMKSVAGMSGTSMDTLTGAITKLNVAQAKAANHTTASAKAFAELGITQKQISGDTGELMGIVADKMAGLNEGWQKNTISMALFGKTGTDLNEFLADYAERGDTVAKITKAQAEQAELYERGMKRLGVMGNQFKEVFGMGVLPVAQAIVKEFISLWNSTGKLTAETKELMKQNVTEWAWGLAKGFAGIIDIGRGVWGVIKGVADQIVGLAIGVVGILDILTSPWDQAKGKWEAMRATQLALGDDTKKNWGAAAAAITGTGVALEVVNKAQANSLKAIAAPNKDGRTPNPIAPDDKNGSNWTGNLDKGASLLAKQNEELAKFLGLDDKKMTLEREFQTLIDEDVAKNNGANVKKLENLKAQAIGIEQTTSLLKQQTEFEKQSIQLLAQSDSVHSQLIDKQRVLVGLNTERSTTEETYNKLIIDALEKKNLQLATQLAENKTRDIALEKETSMLKVIKEQDAVFAGMMERYKQRVERTKNANEAGNSLLGATKSWNEQLAAAKNSASSSIHTSTDPAIAEARLNNEMMQKSSTATDAEKTKAANALNSAIANQNKELTELDLMYAKFDASSKSAWDGAMLGADNFAKSIKPLGVQMADFTQNTLGDFTNRLADMFTTGKFGFQDFVKTAIAALIKLQMQMMMMKSMQFFGFGATAAAAPAAGGVAATGGMVLAAGGAFNRGVKFYANGDIFNSPTGFQHAGGLGVLGEAGPEAVMPLRRGSDGKLGIAMTGNTSGSVQVNNNISVTVQGGNTNSETASAVAEAVVRKIADQRIYDATRAGGIIRQALK